MENIFKNFRKNAKEVLVGTAMLGSLGVATETKASDSKSLDPNKIEIKNEKTKISDSETYDINKKIEFSDSLNIAKFCKTGTTEFFDSNARENAKNAIREFLKNVNFEKNIITITGLCSKERPTPKNDELREARKELGLEMVNEVLAERFSPEEIEKIKIESSSLEKSILDLGFTEEQIQDMSEEMKEILKDRTQGIDISLKKILEIEPDNIKKIPDLYKNVVRVIVDHSKSMAGEAGEAIKSVQEINKTYNKNIEVVNLEGGNQEAHLSTLIHVLSKLEKQDSSDNEILLITDEPDNDVSSREEYDSLMQEVLKLTQEKNIKKINIKFYHPDFQIGGFKVINLLDHKDALFIEQDARKNGSKTSFWESKLEKKYDSLSNEN